MKVDKFDSGPESTKKYKYLVAFTFIARVGISVRLLSLIGRSEYYVNFLVCELIDND